VVVKRSSTSRTGMDASLSARSAANFLARPRRHLPDPKATWAVRR
jgi:hypothetical protein